ncbi:MAG: hypothetical protein WBG28_04735, partial [Desulfobulbales bacterium]
SMVSCTVAGVIGSSSRPAWPVIVCWSQKMQRCGHPWCDIKIGITRGGMENNLVHIFFKYA